MGRKRSFPWRWRFAGLLLLVALAAGGWAWWQGIHWAPDRAEFPVQGVLIGERDGDADFAAIHAIGAEFAYLEASEGANGRDARFAENLEDIRGSGLRFGAVHAYDPCVRAERQSANFLTMVPRDDELLPPVIALDELATDCSDPMAETALESELTTFLNQVESHAGKPAVLKISERFESQYHIAGRIERNLWLESDWMQPDYAGRPWTLWTANSRRRTEAGPLPLRWVAIQP
jgi:lysozyme